MLTSDDLSKTDWVRAKALLTSEEVFEATVMSVNSRGLVVRFGSLRGFVPVAEVRSRPPATSSAGQTSSADKDWIPGMVGTKLLLKVIEADQGGRRLIFSEGKVRKPAPGA